MARCSCRADVSRASTRRRSTRKRARPPNSTGAAYPAGAGTARASIASSRRRSRSGGPHDSHAAILRVDRAHDHRPRRRRAGTRGGGAGRSGHVGRAHHARTDVARSRRVLRNHHAVHDLLRAPRRVRLKQPWPDFITFYTTATGAGWIVPKKYLEKVGDEGFKKAPIGAGPYRFVSFTPGVEVVMEAFDGYWRKRPNVRRIVFKVIPDESTRLAALKRGEVDVVYSIRGALAEELRRTPGLQLKATVLQGTFWLYFPEQWDAKSPWHNPKVREAASIAFDRNAINQAETLGFSRITNSIVPDIFEFFWKPPAAVYDPAKAKRLLAEAGYANGFDAGDYTCDVAYANIAEAVQNYLQAVGIRTRLRPLERAAFFSSYGEKKFRNVVQGASGAFGNAATRLEAFVAAGGTYVYGSYPDIDGLFQEQAADLDLKRRAAMLQRIQQLVHERTVYAPIWQLAFLNGVGPRVEESSLGAIPGFAYSGPYEDVKLKK